MSRLTLFGTALLATAFALPAAAQGGLEFSASVDKPTTTVGGRFTVTVRLKNTGDKELTLPKLAEDRQLVSFDVQLDDGKVFTFEKIHPSPYEMKTDWETGALGAGKQWQLQVDFPALTTGVFSVTAHYANWAPRYEALLAEAEAELETAPDNASLKERVASVKKMQGMEQPPAHLSAAPVKVTVNAAAGGVTDASVRMLTNSGPVRMRLFPKAALGTALHFARLIREGGLINGERKVPFYSGLTFHRVIRGFMIQGGCPNGDGLGSPGYAIPAELAERTEGDVPEALKHVPGRLSMARSGHYDSAGSQFFICVGDSKSLDGEYTVFGEVTRGMDVVYTIAETDTGARDKPIEDVTIDAIELLPADN